MIAERYLRSTWLRFARITLAGLAFLLIVSAGVSADEISPDDQEAIDAARDTLSRGDFDWYEEDGDRARPINFSESTGGAGTFISWTVIAVIIGLILVWVLYLLIVKDKNADEEGRTRIDDDDRADQIEALPQEVRARRGNLLDQARELYEQGDYDRAIVYLYSYQLLVLDRSQWIRLVKGKTNRQYLRELARDGELADIFRRTMHLFEDVYFGHHSLGRSRFESTWNEVSLFHHLVTREVK